MSDSQITGRIENEKYQLAVGKSFTLPNLSSLSKVQKEGSAIWDPRLDSFYISDGTKWIKFAPASSIFVYSPLALEAGGSFLAGATGQITNWFMHFPDATPSYFDTSTGVYTVPEDGLYRMDIVVYAGFTGAGLGFPERITVLFGGTPQPFFQYPGVDLITENPSNIMGTAVAYRNFNAGDTAYPNVAANTATSGGSPITFSINRIGPIQT